MKAHQLINQDSGDTEYYTDIKIVEAARRVMGGIDLDPASSLIANEKIRAKKIFTKEDDGLMQAWHGRVWLNHPFGRLTNTPWIRKLTLDYFYASIDEFLSITFAATSEAWFQPLAQLPQCYLKPRTNYYKPDGTLKRGVTKGSVVTYGGKNTQRFYEVFKYFGVVKVPYDYLEFMEAMSK